MNFYFDEEILRGMKALAILKGTTYSEMIRVACREFVVREGAKAMQDRDLIKRVGAP